MLTLRKAEERGHADYGWLDTYHTFSFADYFEPAHTRFSKLRVINEDVVAAGGGFSTHAHNDMEIFTFIISGALQHKDSMGNTSIIKPGEIQRMTAGTGITHSEFNPSDTEPVHLYQIWIFPEKAGLTPSYQQQDYSARITSGAWTLLASRTGSEGEVVIHQDAKIFYGKVQSGKNIIYPTNPTRKLWLQVIRGELEIAGLHLNISDGLAIVQENELNLMGTTDAEVLLFDLP